MSQPVSSQSYTVASGSSSDGRFINVLSTRAPASTDVNHPIQKRWVDIIEDREYILIGYTNQGGQLLADWVELGTAGGTGILTITGNSGGAVDADGSDNITVHGDGTSINVVGNTGANTLTANVILPAAHTVLISATSSLGGVAPSATVGIPLVSAGAAANPAFGTAVVAGGGTGATTFTAFSVLTGGTTATGALQSVVGLGTAGQALTSAGAGALPTWTTIEVGSAPWADQAAPFNIADGNGYFVSAAVTGTLPTTPVQGATVYFITTTAAVLTVKAAAGQKISINGSASATAGTAASGDAGDSLTLIYRSSDAVWYSAAVIGTWTIT